MLGIFWLPRFGEGVSLGGRQCRWWVERRYRLLIQSFTNRRCVWYRVLSQFGMQLQVLTGGLWVPAWGNGWSWGMEMGPLSSPVVTSYRLPMVTVGLSLTVIAVLRLVIDIRTDGIGLAKGGPMHSSASDAKNLNFLYCVSYDIDKTWCTHYNFNGKTERDW